jgi:rhodanese-related sulfurtransferase
VHRELGVSEPLARSRWKWVVQLGVLALLLVATLAVLTLTLASRLQRLGDVLWIIGASVLGGLLVLAAHPALDWVAPPDEGICEGDPMISPATPDSMLMERVSIEEASTLLEQPLVTFVDARPTYHYAAEHVPGAMNLPAEDAEGLLDMQSLPIPHDGEVITYCDGGSCGQSEYLGRLLRQRDVCQRVRVLEGGWQAWAASGAPTVSGDSRDGDAPSSSQASGWEKAG